MADDFASLRKLPTETARAYAAFLAYVQMGEGRSLSKLQEKLRHENTTKRPPPTIDTIKEWSTGHEWQRRLGEYLQEAAQRLALAREEWLLGFDADARATHTQLLALVEEQVGKFTDMRLTKRRRVPDPDNPGGEMEVITLKVNVRDLGDLVDTRGQLFKDTRAALGLPQAVDLTSKGKAITFQVLGDPAVWDEAETEVVDAEEEDNGESLNGNGPDFPAD